MKKIFPVLTILLLFIPVMAVIATGGKERGKKTMASAAQEKPVVLYYYFPGGMEESEEPRVHQYIEEQSGVLFETRYVKDNEDYFTQLPLTLAAGVRVDLIGSVGLGTMMDYKRRGVTQQITDLIDRYAPNMKNLFTSEQWSSVTVPGEGIWAYPRGLTLDTGTVLEVRKDWRERLGMSTIDTFEELEKYLYAVRDADFDGNGKDDTVPLLGWWRLKALHETILPIFVGTGGIQSWQKNPTYIAPNGEVTPTILHPRFKEYLATLRKWHVDGILYADQVTFGGSEGGDRIASNRVGAAATWYSSTFTGWAALMETVPESELEIVIADSLDGDEGGFLANSPGGPAVGLVSYSKNGEWATRLLDWSLANKTNYITGFHGVPGVDWEYVNEETCRIKRLNDLTHGAFSFLAYTPWNGKIVNTDWRSQQYNNMTAFLGTKKPIYPEDWFVAYNFESTDLPRIVPDAATLVNEAVANIIIGRTPVDEWDDVVADYRKMYGDAFIKEATAQYDVYR